jgi:FkbH-like protein
MYESEFGNKQVWRTESGVARDFRSSLNVSDVERIQLVYWREHCLECSPPECYHSCSLYQARLDRRCLRFDYGIVRNPAFVGSLGFGADVRFRRWAKLETDIYRASLTPVVHRWLGHVDERLARVVTSVAKWAVVPRPLAAAFRPPYNPQRTTYKAFAYLRERALAALNLLLSEPPCDVLIVECHSFEAEPFNLLVEYRSNTVKGRVGLQMKPGSNYHEVLAERLGRAAEDRGGKLSVYPENDATVRAVFTWLDLVTKRPSQAHHRQLTDERLSAKVKCVAWDLDGTIWDGVLIEDGRDNLRVRPEAVAAIKELDRRGIIQTVISKNDYSEAWSMLEQSGLAEFFVYPAINWSPKSANLLEVAKRINIGVDTIALIDDSIFERSEVSETIRDVRVYSDKDIATLCGLPEFDVPVTEMSKGRRVAYQREMERGRVRESFGDDYDSFLRGCAMELRIFVPIEEKHRRRCWELLQRSNQLNLSARKYSESEFERLLATPDLLCVALECSDRFGAYGIVGFASIDESDDTPRLVDFAISCRVAQKMVEHAFFGWLAKRQEDRGMSVVTASFRKTARNGPLIDVFKTLPFENVTEDAASILLRLPVHRMSGYEPVVRVTPCL